MREFLKNQLNYLTTDYHGEQAVVDDHDGDILAVADDCGHILRDIETMAVEHGLPALVASAQACKPTRQSLRVLIAEGLQMVPEKVIERDWLLVSEIADRLRVSPEKVHVWIKEGRIKATNVNDTGRPSWRIQKVDLTNIDLTSEPEPSRRKRRKLSGPDDVPDRY